MVVVVVVVEGVAVVVVVVVVVVVGLLCVIPLAPDPSGGDRDLLRGPGDRAKGA